MPAQNSMEKMYEIKIKAKKPLPYSKIAQKLKKAMNDKTVDMILISIDCPGGAWGAYG